MPELYDDLHTMPVVLWWKILKEIDALGLAKPDIKSNWLIIHVLESFIKCVVFVFINEQRAIANYCNKQREKLNDDFTNFFGVQKRQAKYLKLLCKHQEYVVMYAVTKSHIWTTRRLYVEIELEEYRPKGQKEINEYETLRNVSISLDGASMNPQTMSVIQYYSDQNLAIKRNKQAKANLAKNKK
ncbi:MAG: hypothetical protein IIB31_02150 [Chloroflexi bacterium]|nr:hypothetical protein [Chloroflexota bacterium]